MNIKVLLVTGLFFGMGTANAVTILFVKNDHPRDTVYVTSRTDPNQRAVIAPGGEIQRNINLQGEAVLEFGPAHERKKAYLPDQTLLGLKIDAEGNVHKGLTVE